MMLCAITLACLFLHKCLCVGDMTLEEPSHFIECSSISNCSFSPERYEIDLGHVLGEGGEGTVYTGTRNGYTYAIKVRVFIRENDMNRFLQREWDITKALENTSRVVTARDLIVWSDSLRAGAVYPYVTHTVPLLSNKFHNNIAPSDFVVFIQEVLIALNDIHQAGVIHLDFHIDNILLHWPIHHGAPEVTIIDYGKAQLGYADGKAFPVNQYSKFPPEVASGTSNRGLAVDMWQFGLFLWQVSFQERLMYTTMPDIALDKTPASMLRKFSCLSGTPDAELPCYSFDQLTTSQNRTSNRLYSTELIDLLRGLLDHSPENRLTANQALEHPFFKMYQ